MQWDEKDKWDKKREAQKNIHLNELQKTVRSSGISFDIWEKNTNADGKGSGQYDFTSLLSSDKKKELLKNLPSTLPGAIQSETVKTVQKLWEDFDALCGRRGGLMVSELNSRSSGPG